MANNANKQNVSQKDIVIYRDMTLCENLKLFVSQRARTEVELTRFFLYAEEDVFANRKEEFNEESFEDDITQFCTEYLENYLDFCLEEFEKYYGTITPNLMMLHESIHDKREARMFEDSMRRMPEKYQQEVYGLANILLNMNGQKQIKVNTDIDMYSFETPYPEDEKNTELIRTIITRMCWHLLNEDEGQMSVCIFENDKRTLFNVIADKGVWVPVPKQEVADLYTLARNGVRLATPKNTEFIELERKTLKLF